MKKSYRVKKDKDFQAIFEQGSSIANRRFVIYHLPKSQKHFRVGLSVSKRLGNAVKRNAIKRQLRHILQEFSPYIANEDFVVIARKGVEELSHQEIKKNLCHVLKLAKLYQEGNDCEKETRI